jgi:hypothetical protein
MEERSGVALIYEALVNDPRHSIYDAYLLPLIGRKRAIFHT